MSDTPQIVLDTLIPKPVTVGGVAFVEVTSAHILALEACGNAHLDDKKDITYADTLKACAILTRSGAEARKLAGNPVALDAAVDKLAETIPPAELRAMVPTIMRILAASMSTALRVKSEGGESGESPAPVSAGS